MRSGRPGITTAFDREFGRAALLRRGALIVAAGAGATAFAERAAADTIPDGDVAYLRVLLGAELLKSDFQTTALEAGKLDAAPRRLLRRMKSDDASHAAALTALMNGAGQQPTTADDIDFTYPAGTFASRGSIVKLAEQLGTMTLGAYLGALESVQTSTFRLPLAQIAANEAQQLSALAPTVGRPAIGRAFASALPIDVVSASLDRYES
jgi:hypothetical protein